MMLPPWGTLVKSLLLLNLFYFYLLQYISNSNEPGRVQFKEFGRVVSKLYKREARDRFEITSTIPP